MSSVAEGAHCDRSWGHQWLANSAYASLSIHKRTLPDRCSLVFSVLLLHFPIAAKDVAESPVQPWCTPIFTTKAFFFSFFWYDYSFGTCKVWPQKKRRQKQTTVVLSCTGCSDRCSAAALGFPFFQCKRSLGCVIYVAEPKNQKKKNVVTGTISCLTPDFPTPFLLCTIFDAHFLVSVHLSHCIKVASILPQ